MRALFGVCIRIYIMRCLALLIDRLPLVAVFHSVKQFGTEVKLFKRQLRVFKVGMPTPTLASLYSGLQAALPPGIEFACLPVQLAARAFSSLKNWEHPIASALCMIWLLYMCYKVSCRGQAQLLHVDLPELVPA